MEPTITLDGGLTVPKLGYGTWRLWGQDAYDGVRTALDVGYRHVDTAQGYDNEAEVGRAIADSDVDRDEVFLTTKLKPSNAAAADVRRSTEQSLRDLGVDRVDLLLLHWPAEDHAPLEETMQAMTALVEDGLTRAIGVSNFPSAMLRRAYEFAPLVTDQVEHHPYLAVDAIEEVLREHGGFVTAYSPIARGEVADDPTLTEIADAHDVTATQVTLRWLIQKPGTVAIPKSGNPERIRTNFDVFGFELSDEEMARIRALDRGHRLVAPADGPDWD
ncbi:aldo/keto reductase [Egicoccus sp. AB-alg2]|uniref:aldo/keto reductase n=1 Tax=Egicoccus sp. AB-alg2 TaxID=3242693 RepID=UPI00359ECDFC